MFGVSAHTGAVHWIERRRGWGWDDMRENAPRRPGGGIINLEMEHHDGGEKMLRHRQHHPGRFGMKSFKIFVNLAALNFGKLIGEMVVSSVSIA